MEFICGELRPGEVEQNHIGTFLSPFEDDLAAVRRDVEVAKLALEIGLVRGMIYTTSVSSAIAGE